MASVVGQMYLGNIRHLPKLVPSESQITHTKTWRDQRPNKQNELFFLFNKAFKRKSCQYLYQYKENNDSEYPKNECSMHGYLLQNKPVEQNIYFCLKN